MGLVESISVAADQWISRQIDVSWDVDSIWNDLKKSCRGVSMQLINPDGWDSKGRMALSLYRLLQLTLTDTFRSKCIVLLDEYDTPLIDIRGKSWEEDAKKDYINLLNFIFKDNHSLHTGVLVGVHYVELSDLYSGANNIDVLPLTVMEECRQGTGQTDGTELDCFGELFAFTKPEVEVLVNEVHQKYPAIRRHSTAAIIEKAVEWYDGYCFGICGGKFNPHAVLMFLRKLCATSLDNAACNFWEKTGNQRMVENI
ncbi:hypothetical protein IWW36_006120, partial [Coemansia brasiliensis]